MAEDVGGDERGRARCLWLADEGGAVRAAQAGELGRKKIGARLGELLL